MHQGLCGEHRDIDAGSNYLSTYLSMEPWPVFESCLRQPGRNQETGPHSMTVLEPSEAIVLPSQLRQLNSGAREKKKSPRRGTRPYLVRLCCYETPTQHPNCQQHVDMSLRVSVIEVPDGGMRPSAESRNPSKQLCDSPKAQPDHRH